MASIPRSSRTIEARSGGKIVRRRRSTARRTPYERPSPPPPPPARPNWLTGLVFPASKLIASGAGKFLSSVFTAAPSSSSSSSDSGSASDDGVDDGNDYDIPSEGIDVLKVKNGTSSEMINDFGKAPQLIIGKNKTKHVLEQLLMQETFSREECNRLIQIINSRVVDGSFMKEGQYRGPSEIPNGTIGNDLADLCSSAIMEAKKWLEEKKVRSSSKLDLDTEGEVVSPVYVAKSYMQASLPWASPSIRDIALRTPSPAPIDLSKEGTPSAVDSISFSSSKKRDSLASGSWNIQEEIRRVRSKATEDLLRSLPSKKIDLLSYALETKTTQNPMAADKAAASMGDTLHGLTSLTATKHMDTSVNLASGTNACHGFPVLEMMKDGSHNEAVSSNPAIIVSEQTQDLDANDINEGGAAVPKSHQSISLDLASRQLDDTRSADLHADKNSGKSDEENKNPGGSSHDKLDNSLHMEATCELLSETTIEIPVNENKVENDTTDNINIASGSQNNSSKHYEELSQEPTQLNSEQNRAGTTGTRVVKLQGKQPGRYAQKGRGKGK